MGEIIRTKKFDKSLFIMCLVGAAVGYLIAGTLYFSVMAEWPAIFRTGTYIAVVALCVCLAALISECITGNLRGNSWTGKEIGLGILIIVLAAAVFFLLGMLFQFLYGTDLDVDKKEDIQDYIILIDNSSSTGGTDPANERFSSVVTLVENLGNKQNIMVRIFDVEITDTFPGSGSQMAPAGADTAQKLKTFFDGVSDSNGGTDIQVVLDETVDEFASSGRKCAVLLLSDGESTVDVDEISEKYKKKDLPVYCVSFSGSDLGGSSLLAEIADKTGGFFYGIDQLSNLSNVVETMINVKHERLLFEEVPESVENDMLHRILRVVFITILGCLLGVAVALVVDNSQVMKAGMPLHAAGSLAAGLVMELGWALLPGNILRLLMDLLISLVAVSYWKQHMEFSEDFGVGTGTGGGSGRKKGPARPRDLRKPKDEPDESKSLV